MGLSFPPFSIHVTDARFALSGKVFVSIAVLIMSIIGSDKKLLAIFTSLGGILSSPESFSTLIFLQVFLHPAGLLYLEKSKLG